jgi:hypothetical protein
VFRGRFVASLAAAAALSGLAAPAWAADAFAWTPRDAPGLARGREAAARFDLLPLTEVTVEVDNAFGPASREGLAAAERRLAEVPGVRRVIGPAQLLEAAVDAAGRAHVRPMLARGGSDGDGEAARQRIVRRADALGWFLSANGRLVRFLVDTADFARARPGVEAALVASGMSLERPPAGGGVEGRPLWPDPRAHGARWLPAAVVAGWVLFALGAAVQTRLAKPPVLPGARVAAVLAAAAVGAAAPFLPVPSLGVRAAGLGAAVAAAAVLAGALALARRRRAARRRETPRAPRPPAAVLLTSLALVGAAWVVAPAPQVGTHLWEEAPLLFVSVRGDLDEPVVLRELRRLTDFLRAEPGVANAWSVADFFAGVEVEGEEASRIPDDADQVRRILVQARSDPALRLELSGDHHETLVGIRFDREAPVDRLELVEHLANYLETDLRTSLLRVDLRAPDLGPAPRALAKGLLAADTAERVGRICARSGRTLSGAEAQSVERVARQAALVPAADAGRLKAEVEAEVRGVLRGAAAGAFSSLPPAEQKRLAAEVASLPEQASAAEVRAALAAATGGRVPPAALAATADALIKRTAAARRRHTARINFKEMLYGADLPTEGVLADEVRGATLEGMGPTAGIPVARGSAGTYRIDAVPLGGAVNDHALSEAWEAGLGLGVGGGAVAMAAVLLLAGGPAALASLPVALAPSSMAVLPAALLREPLGLPSLAFLAGALAAGGAIMTALQARRRA